MLLALILYIVLVWNFHIVVPFYLITYFGKRLNYHYMYSYNKKYYLHHTPLCFFNFTKSKDFYKHRELALEKFKELHPNKNLYAKTMTLQDFYERNGYKGVKTKTGLLFVTSSFLGVLSNFRNILNRRTDLFGRIFRVDPKEYKVL